MKTSFKLIIILAAISSLNFCLYDTAFSRPYDRTKKNKSKVYGDVNKLKRINQEIEECESRLKELRADKAELTQKMSKNADSEIKVRNQKIEEIRKEEKKNTNERIQKLQEEIDDIKKMKSEAQKSSSKKVAPKKKDAKTKKEESKEPTKETI